MSDFAVRDTEPLVVAVALYRGPAHGVGEAFDRLLSWVDVYHQEQWGPLIGVYSDARSAAAASDGGAAPEGASPHDAAPDGTPPHDAEPYDSPGPGQVEAEAWLPLPPGVLGMEHADPGVVVRAEEPVRVAQCVHRGYPDAVGQSLGGLLAWIDARGLRRLTSTHRQVYRSAPVGRPGEWEVEIQVAIDGDAAGGG